MSRRKKVKMPDAHEKSFLGLRIPPEDKKRLEAEAKERGETMAALCNRILLGGVREKGGAAVAVSEVEDHANDWEAVVDDVKRLTLKRDELGEMIHERQGLFQSAPRSLRNAFRVCDERIGSASDRLEKLFPSEKRKSLSDILKGK